MTRSMKHLRRKRSQAASELALGAKLPPRPSRPSVGRSEPLPPARYPVTRSSLGKRQGGG
jgi:hypothetical protein